MTGQTSPPTRLRSKTADISDLLRGTRVETNPPESRLPMPPLPDAEGAAKPKHKLSFFARRRKSSSASPAAAKSAANEAKSRTEEGPPPLPNLDIGRLSTSKNAGRRSTSTPASPSSPPAQTSLPSSLPPLNVSPPSLSPLPQLTPSKSQPRISHAPQAHAVDAQSPQKQQSAIPTFRHLRTQKSTSFEYSRRSQDSQKLVQAAGVGVGAVQGQRQSRPSGERPIITVSAPPPSIDEDEETYITPRTAPPPPVQRSMPLQGYPRPSVRDARESPDSARTHPASPTTPQSPRFPVPHTDASELSTEDIMSTRTSISSMSSTRETLSALARSGKSRLQRHASALPLGLQKPKQEKGGAVDVSLSAPESSTRGAPVAGDPPAGKSRIPASSSFKSNLRKAPPPLLTNLRRSPRAHPPTEPLPSPPPSASLRVGTEDGLQSMAAMPTIPSLASRMSVGEVHQLVFRSRANTVSTQASRSTVSHDGRISPGEPSTTPVRDKFLQDRDAPRTPIREQAEEHELGPEDAATVEQLREALRAQSAKYQRLSAYLLTLSERHAVEKNELVRRIEGLEREARKREREVTGLRWLVMNAGQRGAGAGAGVAVDASPSPSPSASGSSPASPPRPAAVTRLRNGSGSKSCHGSPRHGSAGASPGEAQRGMSMDSTVDSMEEGLFEMQRSISDLIAPLAPSPANSEAVASPQVLARASPGNGHGSGHSRIRRSNTLPDALSQFSPAVQKQKQARRTSSPILPTVSSTGLGIDMDIPSIPSLSDADAEHMTPASSSSASALSSVPPLTTANTASSGLSVIPESPMSPRQSSDLGRLPAEQDRLDAQSATEEDKRASHGRTRHLSASSTSSSVSASSAVQSNSSKIGASVSIGQVLDRSNEVESDMSAVLRKLWTYGSK